MAAQQASFGSLIARTISNGQKMVKTQVALAQAELKSTGEAAAKIGIFAIIAIGSLTLFTVFLLITIAYVLVEVGLPVWAGFGIVTVMLLLVALIMGLLAKGQTGKLNGPKIVVEELQQTKQELEQTLGLPASSP